ncbi:MAG: segregation/condensation protein A [Nanoarchaeota archaeon]|nr:segregation/condensation protein A [Nanoarchaeota archaeon]
MQEDKLYNIILSEDLTWEGLIRDIVAGEGLDPWDIDISLLVRKYLEAIKLMKKLDIRVSGKFILAAAILLKMKADYLLAKRQEEVEEEKEEEKIEIGEYELHPHVPQPKKRKVTIEELISSLRKAIVVSEKRKFRQRQREVKIKLKLKKIDLSEKIALLYTRILDFFKKFNKDVIKFSSLVPSKQREDILWTFIPLIHLANKGKVKIEQEEEFGEIYVRAG